MERLLRATAPIRVLLHRKSPFSERKQSSRGKPCRSRRAGCRPLPISAWAWAAWLGFGQTGVQTGGILEAVGASGGLCFPAGLHLGIQADSGSGPHSLSSVPRYQKEGTPCLGRPRGLPPVWTEHIRGLGRQSRPELPGSFLSCITCPGPCAHLARDLPGMALGCVFRGLRKRNHT